MVLPCRGGAPPAEGWARGGGALELFSTASWPQIHVSSVCTPRPQPHGQTWATSATSTGVLLPLFPICFPHSSQRSWSRAGGATALLTTHQQRPSALGIKSEPPHPGSMFQDPASARRSSFHATCSLSGLFWFLHATRAFTEAPPCVWNARPHVFPQSSDFSLKVGFSKRPSLLHSISTFYS